MSPVPGPFPQPWRNALSYPLPARTESSSVKSHLQSNSEFCDPSSIMSPHRLRANAVSPHLFGSSFIDNSMCFTGLCVDLGEGRMIERSSWPRVPMVMTHADAPPTILSPFPIQRSPSPLPAWEWAISQGSSISSSYQPSESASFTSHSDSPPRYCPEHMSCADGTSCHKSSQGFPFEGWQTQTSPETTSGPENTHRSTTYSLPAMSEYDPTPNFSSFPFEEEEEAAKSSKKAKAKEATAGDEPLRRRRRLTTDENARFKCGQCYKPFSRSFNFKKHMETHDPLRPRPNRCAYPYCNRSFVRKTDLKRHHESVHQRSRRWKCRFCGSGFPRRDSLRRHEEDGCLLRGEAPKEPAKAEDDEASTSTRTAKPPFQRRRSQRLAMATQLQAQAWDHSAAVYDYSQPGASFQTQNPVTVPMPNPAFQQDAQSEDFSDFLASSQYTQPDPAIGGRLKHERYIPGNDYFSGNHGPLFS